MVLIWLGLSLRYLDVLGDDFDLDKVTAYLDSTTPNSPKKEPGV